MGNLAMELDGIASNIDKLETCYEETYEELKVAERKIDEQEVTIEELRDEVKQLTDYAEYVESVYPEIKQAYWVSERMT